MNVLRRPQIAAQAGPNPGAPLLCPPASLVGSGLDQPRASLRLSLLMHLGVSRCSCISTSLSAHAELHHCADWTLYYRFDPTSKFLALLSDLPDHWATEAYTVSVPHKSILNEDLVPVTVSNNATDPVVIEGALNDTLVEPTEPSGQTFEVQSPCAPRRSCFFRQAWWAGKGTLAACFLC